MLSDIGYALNAVGYVVLLLLLLTVRKSGLPKSLLVIASIATVFWSLGHVTALFGPVSVNTVIGGDTIRQLIWLLFIGGCLNSDVSRLKQLLRQPSVLAIIAFPAVVLAVDSFALPWSIKYLLQVALALEVLVLLELIYRQAGDKQWAYKPLVIYLGVINLLNFVIYANAAMVNVINPNHIAARGFVHLFLTPFLVIAIHRMKHWGVRIFISRDVVLHSTLMLVAGIYLCVMAGAGYVISYLGYGWGTTIQLVLLVMSLVLLFALLMSNNFRTQIKIFITKHFFANQYDYRVEWLKLTKSLPSSTANIQEVYRNALFGTAQAVGYESGAILKCQGTSYRVLDVLQRSALNQHEEQLIKHIAKYSEQNDHLIDLDDYLVRPFNYAGLSLSKELLDQVNFNLVVGLKHDDKLWGFIFLCRQEHERVKLNWEVREYLTAVAEQVGTYIYHNEAAQSVAENAQFAAFNRTSAFVLHDLKNVLAQVDLILCNAEQHKHNPEFIDDTFDTLEHTKTRMERMLKQLTEKKSVQGHVEEGKLLSELIRSVISKQCQSLSPCPKLTVVEEVSVPVDSEKCSNVIYHLVSNAQQATPDEGEVLVKVTISHDRQFQIVKITDTGCGMEDDFILNRLFKPFDTTKGNAGMGIGAFDAKSYMESIGGNIDVTSEVGKGSEFTLHFPIGKQIESA